MLTYAAPKAELGCTGGHWAKASFQTVIECGPGVRQLQRPGGKEEVTGIKGTNYAGGRQGRGKQQWTDHLPKPSRYSVLGDNTCLLDGMGNRCAEWRAASQESLG